MSVKLLFSGDYEFMCHMYGLSGASGIAMHGDVISKHTFTLIGCYCCLWCEISGDKLIIPRKDRGRFASRTLEKLRSDHQRFLLEGGGNLKKAKFYNNAITEHFFNIPIDSVCTVSTHWHNVWFNSLKIGLPTWSAHYPGCFLPPILTSWGWMPQAGSRDGHHDSFH